MNQSAVMALFDQLTGNHVHEFLGSQAMPGENQGMHVELTDASDTKHELLFWKTKNKTYARDLKSLRKEVLELDPSVGQVLPWTQDFFEKTPVAAGTKTPPNGHPEAHEDDH